MSHNNSQPFIPAWLDDMGLTQAQFRIYCHLCRRAGTNGDAYPSMETILNVCKMSKPTLCDALKFLEGKGLIKRVSGSGSRTNRYKALTPPIGKKENLSLVKNNTHHRSKREPIIGKKENHKGTPYKDIQLSNISPNGSKSQTDDILESIYQAYPRKVSKKEALKAIQKALKNHDSDFLLKKTKLYAEKITWQEARYIPHPSTWFNGERFNDDLTEWENPNKGVSQGYVSEL